MRARARAHYTRARGFNRRPIPAPPGERVRDMSWLHAVGTTTACVGVMKTRRARHGSVYTRVFIYTFPSYDNYYNLIYYYITLARDRVCVHNNIYRARVRVYIVVIMMCTNAIECARVLCLCVCVYGLPFCRLGFRLLHRGQEKRGCRVDRTCDITWYRRYCSWRYPVDTWRRYVCSSSPRFWGLSIFVIDTIGLFHSSRNLLDVPTTNVLPYYVYSIRHTPCPYIKKYAYIMLYNIYSGASTLQSRVSTIKFVSRWNLLNMIEQAKLC